MEVVTACRLVAVGDILPLLMKQSESHFSSHGVLDSLRLWSSEKECDEYDEEERIEDGKMQTDDEVLMVCLPVFHRPTGTVLECFG